METQYEQGSPRLRYTGDKNEALVLVVKGNEVICDITHQVIGLTLEIDKNNSIAHIEFALGR